MTIERRIQITALILILYVAVLGLILYWSYFEVNRGIAAIELTSQIERSVFKTRVLMKDYIEQGSKTILGQWEHQNSALDRILDESTRTASLDPALLENLRKRYDAVNLLYPRLKEIKAASPAGGANQDARGAKMLASLISLQLEQLVQAANVLSASTQTMALKKREFVGRLNIGLGVLAVIIILANIFVIRSSVVAPLQQLSKGAEIVGAGEFQLLPEIKREDEVGKLTQAFNRMITGIANQTAALKNAQSELELRMEQRTAAYETVRRQNELLKAVHRAQTQFISLKSPEEIYRNLLNDLLALTDSKFGFIGELLYTPEGQAFLRDRAISDIAWNEETRKMYKKFSDEKGLDFPIIRGLWGEVIRTGEAVISNEPAGDPRRGGLPEGHPPLHSFLGLPFHSDDEIIGMAGIANRPGGYSPELAEFLQPYVVTCAAIIDAYRTENHRREAEAKLLETNRRLEALMKALPVGVSFSNDASCQRITGNPCLLDQFEISPEENISASAGDPAVPGPLVRFFDNGREVQEHELPLQRAVAERKMIPPMEMEVDLPSGRRWVAEASGAPILDEQGNVVGGVAVTVDITDRKRAEVALSANKERLAQALEAGQFGSWSLDAKTGKTWRSLRHDQIFGYLELLPDWTVEKFLDHVLQEDLRAVSESISHAFRKRTEYGFECRICRTDGVERWIWVQGRPRFDEHGELIEMVGLVQDVTEHKEALEAVQRAHDELELRVRERTAELETTKESLAIERQRLYDILENLPVMVCLLTPDHHVAFANRSFRDKYGDNNGQHCHEYVFGQEEPCSFCRTYDVLKTGKPEHWECSGPDGCVIDVHAVPFSDTDGSLLILELDVDITEQRRAEEALRAERQRFNDVLNVLPAYVILLTPTYHVPFANRFFEDRFGKSNGKRCFEYLFDRTEPCEICETFTVLKTDAPHHWEWTGPDGRTYDIYDFPFIDTDGSRLIMEVGLDITDQKRAEVERENLIKELEAKNAELERFTYSVSHDLKSPLITIMSFLGFIEEEAVKGNIGNLRADLNRISRAATKMGQLLDEVLELSRIGRMVNASKEIPMRELIDEAVELLSGRISERRVTISILPDLPALYGDRPRLLEVFQNLIENSVKFMGDQPNPEVEIGARMEDRGPVFYVRDNGIGIDPLYQDRIFRLFDKLDQKTEGTGIGLALVKRIIEVHKGHIWLETEGIGKGCTFCFTLPPVHVGRDKGPRI